MYFRITDNVIIARQKVVLLIYRILYNIYVHCLIRDSYTYVSNDFRDCLYSIYFVKYTKIEMRFGYTCGYSLIIVSDSYILNFIILILRAPSIMITYTVTHIIFFNTFCIILFYFQNS